MSLFSATAETLNYDALKIILCITLVLFFYEISMHNFFHQSFSKVSFFHCRCGETICP